MSLLTWDHDLELASFLAVEEPVEEPVDEPGPSAAPAAAVRFGHVSFAVHDALRWGARFRRDLGATPVTGAVTAGARSLLVHVGDATDGGLVELAEPLGRTSPLARFLTARGEGVHHLTFVVPDLADTVATLREGGHQVVGEDLDHEPWREAFVAADAAHGLVLHLVQTDLRHPPVERLLAGRERDAAQSPSPRGATDHHWWESVWESTVLGDASLGDVHLRSRDVDLSARLFGGLLGGEPQPLAGGGTRYAWEGGAVCVHHGREAGICAVDLGRGGPPRGVQLGRVLLGGMRRAG
ncbi:VOC family protein [Nocardioides sp. GY 10127]|uniref:VOC family protein n=1 Tax=Nocardioides sp. GY 10127 TaxID=2569762 RepID=UPI0010A8010C|nr:VOC family protein [Nocardioides sp. GY 10127]TIC80040.1 hypothetical protein E8D37_15535 [Nocardioides sp. GY 10127]